MKMNTNNLKLRTRDEYYAEIKTLRETAARMDKASISSTAQARDMGKQIAALTKMADSMERAALFDGTVKLEWQQAENQREQERDTTRMQNVMALDRRVNPQNHVDHDTAREYLNNAVDLFSGLDDSAKIELTARLLAGQGQKDVDGGRYIAFPGGRATLHKDSAGDYVSFIKEGGERFGE